jgi:hypothetical protein
VVLLPDWQRAPASIRLGYSPLLGASTQGAVVVQPDARIEVDVGGTIELTSGGGIWSRGDLVAPAGRIALDVVAAGSFLTYLPHQTIRVAAGSTLAAGGAFLAQPDSLGYRRGVVLAGGVVEIDAARGFLVLEDGSGIDVGGAAAVLDLPRSSPDRLEPVLVTSDAGSVVLSAAEGGVIAGAIRGLPATGVDPATVRAVTPRTRIPVASRSVTDRSCSRASSRSQTSISAMRRRRCWRGDSCSRRSR